MGYPVYEDSQVLKVKKVNEVQLDQLVWKAHQVAKENVGRSVQWVLLAHPENQLHLVNQVHQDYQENQEHQVELVKGDL